MQEIKVMICGNRDLSPDKSGIRTFCNQCHTPLVMAPSTSRVIDDTYIISCEPCAMKMHQQVPGPAEWGGLMPGQVEEMLKILGIQDTPEVRDRIAAEMKKWAEKRLHAYPKEG